MSDLHFPNPVYPLPTRAQAGSGTARHHIPRMKASNDGTGRHHDAEVCHLSHTFEQGFSRQWHQQVPPMKGDRLVTETTESPTRTRTNLRLKSPLHIAFASAARERGVSFNNLAEDVLEDFVVRISECLALIPREDMTVSLEAQLKGELEGAARAYGVSLNRLIEEVCQSWVMTVYRVSDEPQHQPQPS